MVILIDIYDLYSELSKQSFEERTFPQLKRDLDALEEQKVVFEALHQSSLFEDKSVHVSNDHLLQARLLISEIKEKQEIIDKLDGLASDVGLLRSTVLTNDKEKASRLIRNITQNQYYGISNVVNDLNTLKTKIGSLEKVHEDILSKTNLEANTQLQEEFEKKHSDLKDLHKQQKNVFLNLTNIFMQLAKQHINK